MTKRHRYRVNVKGHKGYSMFARAKRFARKMRKYGLKVTVSKLKRGKSYRKVK